MSHAELETQSGVLLKLRFQWQGDTIALDFSQPIPLAFVQELQRRWNAGDHEKPSTPCFEVSYFDTTTKSRKVFGWSDTQAGVDAMMRAISRHPAWEAPEVRER